MISGEGVSSRKRAAATTALLGIGIHEDKSLAHEASVVIENRAVQIDIAFQIAKEFDVLTFENLIAGARLVFEREIVGEAGASSAFHTDTQSGGLDAFLLHPASHFVHGVVANLNGMAVTFHCRRVSFSSHRSPP